MTIYAWGFLALAVIAVVALIAATLVIRRKDQEVEYARTSRKAYRSMLADLRQRLARERLNAEDKQDALSKQCQRIRNDAQVQMGALRSQNERLRTWQLRVIDGSAAAHGHLSEYARELSDESQDGAS